MAESLNLVNVLLVVTAVGTAACLLGIAWYDLRANR
jgi:hypothetical protein